jgi:hypothetical protein
MTKTTTMEGGTCKETGPCCYTLPWRIDNMYGWRFTGTGSSIQIRRCFLAIIELMLCEL